MLIRRLKVKNLSLFLHKFEAKYSVVNYMSNIGGIISLWFGLAVIDTGVSIIMKRRSKLSQFFFKYFIDDYLVEALKNTRVFKLFSKILEFRRELLNHLEFYNFKLWMKLILILCVFYEVFV